MRQDTIQRINDHYVEFPFASANKPCSLEEVTQLESDLGFRLPDDYKQFLFLYGAGDVGAFPIFGFGVAQSMGLGVGSAWDETLAFRNPKPWPGTENWLVFSIDCGGSPIGLDRDGIVCLSDHGDIVKIADSFEDYLWEWC